MSHNPVRLRVLVAEDSECVQRAVVRLLKEEFEIVAVVSSGGDLVKAALALKPDVIVSDLAMPTLTGAEALTLLRDSGQPTPFVIMTATDWHPRKWIAMGALGVVHKADLHVDLAAAVRAAASGDRYISRSALKSSD